jgi:hypothetical protein
MGREHNPKHTLCSGSTVELKFIPVVLHAKELKHVPQDVFFGTVYVLPKDWPRLIRHVCGVPQRLGDRAAGRQASIVRERKQFGTAQELPSVLFVGAQKGTISTRVGNSRRPRKLSPKLNLDRLLKSPAYLISRWTRSSWSYIVCPLAYCTCLGNRRKAKSSCTITTGSLPRYRPINWQHSWQSTQRCCAWSSWIHAILPQAEIIARRVDFAVGVRGTIAEPVAIDFFAMCFTMRLRLVRPSSELMTGRSGLDLPR